MEKENQRVAITKRMLKDALLQLLSQKEIGKISITELCKAAQINRATFYRHYYLPQDLLLEIEKDIICNAQDIAPLPSKIKDAKPYLEKLFTYVYDHADIIRVLIRSNTEANLVHMFDQYNYALLTDKLSTKDNMPFDSDSLKLLSTYLSGGGYHLVRAWLTEDISKTPQEIAALVYNLITRDLDSYIIKP